MAKSPFAEKKVETYKYPSPLDATEIDGEPLPEAVVKFRADQIDPEVVEDGEEAPWIRLRIPRSKHDLDTIADLTQGLTAIEAEGATIKQQLARGNRGVFELISTAWSFDRECNGAAFDDLDLWASDWISACMADALRRGQQRAYKKKETESVSSPEPESSAAPLPATHQEESEQQ